MCFKKAFLLFNQQVQPLLKESKKVNLDYPVKFQVVQIQQSLHYQVPEFCKKKKEILNKAKINRYRYIYILTYLNPLRY